MDIEGVLAIVFLFGGGTLVLLAISPIGRAIADRIRGKGQQAEVGAVRSELLEHKEALEQELEAVRRELAELAERVDEGPKRGVSADQLPLLRAELLDELQQVRQQVGDLADRLDFAERLLAQKREGERLAPPRGG